MAGKASSKSGKGILIVVILTLLAIVAGVTSVVLLSQNRTISQIFGGSSNVYDSAKLSELSMNGQRIGDTIPSSIKQHLVLDADFMYMYRGVAYWIDANDKITKLAFYTSTDAAGNYIESIDDADIQYHGEKLVTVADFEETFGLASITEESNNAKYYKYTQGDYRLTLYVKSDKVHNVVLSKE